MTKGGRQCHGYWANAQRLATITILLILAGSCIGVAAEAPMIAVKIAMPQTTRHSGDRVRLHIEEDNFSDQLILLSENRTGDVRSGIVVKGLRWKARTAAGGYYQQSPDGSVGPSASATPTFRTGWKPSKAVQPDQGR
jgi:hypothetical protein